MDDTTAKLIQIVADRFHLEAKKLKPEDDLYERLGIDSLQAFDLLGELEAKFDVSIPDYYLREATTLGALAAVIEKSR